MAPFTILGRFQDLVEWLHQEGVPHAVSEDAQVVELPTRSLPLQGSMFVRWEKALPFVQVIHPMVQDVATEKLGAVAGALVLVNHAIALPGFALDPQKRFIYFRQTLQLDDEGKIKVEVMARMLKAVVNNARDFLLAFRGVATGEIPADNVLKAALEHKQAETAAAQAAQPPGGGDGAS